MARIVSTKAVNAIRNNHNVYNPVSLAYENGILIEAPRTNSLTFSDDFNNAAWTKTLSTITSDIISSPESSTLADKLVESGAVGIHYFSRACASFTAGAVQSFSVYVKAGERTRGQFYLSNVDNLGISFDLATATVVSRTSGASVLTQSDITALGNGWYRISFSGTLNGAGTTGSIAFVLADSAGVVSYAGDGTSGLYVWGLQQEIDQPFTSSYIPTTAATVTRSIENYSIPYTLPPQEMTVYCKFIESGSTLTNLARLFHFGTSSDLNALLCYASAGAYRIQHHNGTVTVSSSPAAVPVIGNQVEFLATIYSDGSVKGDVSINEAAIIAGVRSAAAAFNTAFNNTFVGIGSKAATVGFNTFLSFKVARGNFTLAQMRALGS